eukprot:CAMPEP_0116897012 /NCGR_PEP_ID=MMETSP0467-20121206/6117_1 /TAXON_ID=283647 /ORGANISM="Mesodinium pulex, Strain SPMC105" /LENGTH=145 /DNA_ID=CAMNT_0004568479 /DNA_START=1798 /DNA_END=2235 /DNA_ORIENTATION=+
MGSNKDEFQKSRGDYFSIDLELDKGETMSKDIERMQVDNLKEQRRLAQLKRDADELDNLNNGQEDQEKVTHSKHNKKDHDKDKSTSSKSKNVKEKEKEKEKIVKIIDEEDNNEGKTKPKAKKNKNKAKVVKKEEESGSFEDVSDE